MPVGLPRVSAPNLTGMRDSVRNAAQYQQALELERIKAAKAGGGAGAGAAFQAAHPGFFPDPREGRRPSPGLADSFGVGAGGPTPNRLNDNGTRDFFPAGSAIPEEDPARQGSGASPRLKAAMEKFSGVADGSMVFSPTYSPTELMIIGQMAKWPGAVGLGMKEMVDLEKLKSTERIAQLEIDNAPNRTPSPGLADTFGPQGGSKNFGANTFGPLRANLPPQFRDTRSGF